MRHLIVTIPRYISERLETEAEVKAFLDNLHASIEDWRENGTPLIVTEGVRIELIDLTAIAPGHRVCCL